MKKRQFRKGVITALRCLVLIGSLLLLFYPEISDFWNSLGRSRILAGYDEALRLTDKEDLEQERAAAEAYNNRLKEAEHRFVLNEAEQREYESLLDISGTGIMCRIIIPVIHVSLPVYHGCEAEILQKAAGHFAGSSLPVGGPSTHCVISGHSGLPSAKLFTDLPKLKEGDRFYLETLGETLTYRITEIQVVLPEELDALEIEEGRDLVTLVTCTPYGINSHRLLVQGERIH